MSFCTNDPINEYVSENGGQANLDDSYLQTLADIADRFAPGMIAPATQTVTSPFSTLDLSVLQVFSNF